VSRLTNKKKYPSVCTCFYGETIKSNFEKIYNQLKELLDKKEQDYNISPDVIKGNNEFREKLSCVQFNIPLLSKEHIFSLKDNRLTITLFNSKEDTKKSIEFYKKLCKEKNNFSEDDKILIKKVLEIHKLELENTKNKKCCFRIEFKYRPIKKINEKIIEKGNFLKNHIVDNVFKLIDNYNIKGNGATCCYFEFDSNNHALIGNIDLPVDIFDTLGLKDNKYAKEIIKKTGIPILTTLNFEMKKSPLGIAEIEIHNNDSKYYIGLKTNYRTKKVEDLIIKNYLILQKFSQYIMEVKK